MLDLGEERGLTAAARDFERAARVPVRRAPCQASAQLRAAGHLLHSAGRALSSRQELTAVVAALCAAVPAAVAARRWHTARAMTAQAAAAGLAADQLQQAAEALGAPPRPRPDPVAAARTDLEQAVRTALAGLAAADPELVLRDPAWPTLAGVLAHVQQLGHDPAAVLAKAASGRELHSADSVAKVLISRLQGRLAQPSRRRPAAGGHPHRRDEGQTWSVALPP